MIELIILLIVVFAFAFIAGWKAREYQAIRYLQQYQQMVEQTVKDVAVNTVMIDVRREGDKFYVYDKNTGEFLAQGTNHAEVSAVLGERFPTKRFTAMPQNLKDVGYHHDSL